MVAALEIAGDGGDLSAVEARDLTELAFSMVVDATEAALTLAETREQGEF